MTQEYRVIPASARPGKLPWEGSEPSAQDRTDYPETLEGWGNFCDQLAAAEHALDGRIFDMKRELHKLKLERRRAQIDQMFAAYAECDASDRRMDDWGFLTITPGIGSQPKSGPPSPALPGSYSKGMGKGAEW